MRRVRLADSFSDERFRPVYAFARRGGNGEDMSRGGRFTAPLVRQEQQEPGDRGKTPGGYCTGD